jgi:hypothetical protein
MEWERRSAYVFVKCYPGKNDKVYNMIREWKNVFGVFTTTGNWDLIAWFDAEDIEESYKWISKIRYWPEVERTSTHQTYQGWVNGTMFWEKPAYSWVKVRSSDIYSTYEEMKLHDWVATVASVPGEWDCVAMLYGESYEEVHHSLWELTTRGYEVEYYAPLNSYWNKEFVENWCRAGTVAEPAVSY